MRAGPRGATGAFDAGRFYVAIEDSKDRFEPPPFNSPMGDLWPETQAIAADLQIAYDLIDKIIEA